MRPVIVGLDNDELRVQLQLSDVDAALQEHSFSGIDIPPAAQKLLSAVRFVVLTLNGNEDATFSVLAEKGMLGFGGFRDCRMSIKLNAAHVEVLREAGSLRILLPEDQYSRVAQVNCIDLTLIDDASAPFAEEENNVGRATALSLD